MDALNIIFGGVGGAVIGSIISGLIAYSIYRKSKRPPTGKAYEILKGLGKRLREPEGEYHLTRSSDDNFKVASHIYSHADGPTIATTFHDDPSTYGEIDLVRSFKFGGSLFTRITSDDVCGPSSAEIATESLSRILKGSNLVVIPRNEAFTRMDGIYCRLSDDTHLSFLTFRDPENKGRNKGIFIRDGIAETMFEYYETIARTYKVGD